MAYSPRLRQAVGGVRRSLESAGIALQDERFSRHGEHRPDRDAPLVMVACSGGRDSMALAAAAHTVCASLGVRCGAVLIDHRLQEGSRRVSEEAAERCRAIGLDPVVVRGVTVVARGQGVEAAARQARYEALAEVAHTTSAAAVLLAHTRNDQAETILMGLLRSSGIDALAGMPARFERDGVTFLRPLLDMTREQTTGLCRDLGMSWWDDPTNAEHIDPSNELPSRYPLRTRIRHDLVPYLERFTGADIVGHLTSSPQAGLDKAYLDERADELVRRGIAITGARSGAVSYEGEAVSRGARAVIDVDVLGRAHQAIRLRAIAHALHDLGVQGSSAQVVAIDRLIADWHGQGPVSLPSGYSASRQKHVIRVCQDGGHADC